MATTTIKNQNFGIEIELTGIRRDTAAKLIAEYFGTGNGHFEGGVYNTSYAVDQQGRKWKCMRDASVTDPSCEVVSPICTYEDIEHIQQIVRILRQHGARADSSCGIHVHINGAVHTPTSIACLMTLMYARQDLFTEALENARRRMWCSPVNKELVSAIKKQTTKDGIEKTWYSDKNIVRDRQYRGTVDYGHYNETRYHNINLHAFFTKGTVEFRMFNGTTHAGMIKTYIQFCLAMSAWATEAKPSYWFTKTEGMDNNGKLKAMEDLLERRFKMTGAEFKTARMFLTKAFRNESEAVA